MARQSLDNSLDADIRDIDHYKKKRVLSRFEDEEAFFDKTQNDTTTEARNVKGIASSRMPFSEYRQQMITDNDEEMQFGSAKKSSAQQPRLSFLASRRARQMNSKRRARNEDEIQEEDDNPRNDVLPDIDKQTANAYKTVRIGRVRKTPLSLDTISA